MKLFVFFFFFCSVLVRFNIESFMDFMLFEIFTDDFQAPPDESCQKNRKKRRKEKKNIHQFLGFIPTILLTNFKSQI